MPGGFMVGGVWHTLTRGGGAYGREWEDPHKLQQ